MGDVEIYLVDTFGAERKDEEQAKFCAAKIKEIIRSGYEIFDKNLGRRRPAAFSDFAILVPTGRLVKIHEDALKKAGIPAVSDVTASIFDTVEVNVMISLLEAVDKDVYKRQALRCVCNLKNFGREYGISRFVPKLRFGVRARHLLKIAFG